MIFFAVPVATSLLLWRGILAVLPVFGFIHIMLCAMPFYVAAILFCQSG